MSTLTHLIALTKRNKKLLFYKSDCMNAIRVKPTFFIYDVSDFIMHFNLCCYSKIHINIIMCEMGTV